MMQPHNSNGLLALVPPDELAELRIATVNLPIRTKLETMQRTVRTAYFMTRGVAIAYTHAPGRTAFPTAIIGSEGMTGAFPLLGDDRSSSTTEILLSGAAQAIDASMLKQKLPRLPALRSVLDRYLLVSRFQYEQTILAFAKGSLDERLARVLLMLRDRAESDAVSITHDMLSCLIGTRRAGVTTAINTFQTRGLIDTSRGSISILDPKGLRRLSNGLYGGAENYYRRLLPCGNAAAPFRTTKEGGADDDREPSDRHEA